MLLNYALSGSINPVNLKLIALCSPVVLGVMFLAELLQARINQTAFSKVTNSLLLVTGLVLLVSR